MICQAESLSWSSTCYFVKPNPRRIKVKDMSGFINTVVMNNFLQLGDVFADYWRSEGLEAGLFYCPDRLYI